MSRHRNMEDDDDVDEFLYGAPESVKEQHNDSTMKESNPTEDDDLYQLYRGSTANETQEVGSSRQDVEMDEDQSGSHEQVRPMEEEEEEDSDDDLEIILEPEEDSTAEQSKDTGATSEEKSSLVNIKPGQQNKIPGNASGSGTPNTSAAAGGNAASASAQAKGSVGTSGINLEAVGEYNGVPITEVDLDGLDDKPWRKPGADITDYFNYGFNEVTWRAYCAQQKMIRESRKMMGDMDMSEFMPMGMMMPPGMMDNNNGGMPMGMPNMMGMPGMPGMPGAPNPAMAAAAAAAMSSPAAAGSSPAVMSGNRNMMRPAGRSSGRQDGGNERDGGNEGGMGGSFFWPPQMQPPFFS
ncbi:hypothetical protein LRAMOSA09078 [Lichtheimia ramosa]|uniref:Pre-mRNA polyadenylation factor Fip1 domain-containing protein n=1 Tax=Lichtheimia ramosa TaxID=688394 RepID=A0A077WGQ9_9FUNG|nr:hypothetical protein LRAMOSA09078 [Lichtheimia ramosa]